MFLIAKIVRGRRLLHELEQQEKDEAAAAIDAANSLSQMSRRLAARQRRSSPMIEGIPMEDASTERIRRKAVRQKTIISGSVDSSPENDPLSLRRTSSMPSVCDAATAIEYSVSDAKVYDYDKKLNKMQRRALRFTWHRLQTRNGGKRVENVFEEVFDRLVRQIPQIRDMFTTRMFLCAMSRNETSSLRDHARVMVKMVDLAIKNLDAERSKRTDVGTNLDPRLVGRAHGQLRPYGFTGQYWEKFGEMMVDVVLCQEAVRDLPGAGQAWVILTACLIDQLRAGFDENRSLQPIFPKQSTVLHNAARHLHSESIDEPCCSTTEFNGEDQTVPAPLPTSSGRRLPFTPKLGRQESIAEPEDKTPSPVMSSCPFASRGSMRDATTRSSPETPAIAIN